MPSVAVDFFGVSIIGCSRQGIHSAFAFSNHCQGSPGRCKAGCLLR